MPDPGAVIDTLFTVGDESAHIFRGDLFPGACDDHDKGVRVERYKGLAAQRVPFDQPDLVWQFITMAFNQADDRLSILTG